MFCKYCGKELPEDVIFCPYSGKNQTGSNTPQTQNSGAHKVKKTVFIIPAVLIAALIILIIGIKSFDRNDDTIKEISAYDATTDEKPVDDEEINKNTKPESENKTLEDITKQDTDTTPTPTHTPIPTPESYVDSAQLLNAFINGEVAAEGDFEGKNSFMIYDLLENDEEWLKYRVGDWIDADNDGEDELIMDGPYGGMILDARNGKVVILAQGEGSAGVLKIAVDVGGFWIAHCDTSHAGREIYCLDLYNGDGNIVDSEVLSAEYYDNPNDQYDENSTFTYDNKLISMRDFEDIRWELFESWNEPVNNDQ